MPDHSNNKNRVLKVLLFLHSCHPGAEENGSIAEAQERQWNQEETT